ncbi:hypothetical protein WDU94_004448 [Cyamophila willieti]
MDDVADKQSQTNGCSSSNQEEHNVNKEDDCGSETFSEEIEPRLKFMRLMNNVAEILSTDIASCVAVHPKFICMGTEWGDVHLLDHQGNSIKSQPLRHHSICVSSISIDLSGEYIASCSHDGKVHVYGLYSSSDDMHVNLQTVLRSVQINPHYKKSSKSHRFVTGDVKLILHEKTILSRVRSTTLSDASMEGGVINMSWANQFIAWATNVGMRVYDIQARTSLGLIKWKKNTR